MNGEEARRLVDRWLGQLGSLSLDEDGSCIIQQEEHDLLIGVDLPKDSTTLLLQALLLPVEESQTGLLVTALEANLFQTKTGGGAIALDTATGHLIFCHQFGLRDDSTESQFMSFLESFINLSLVLRVTLSPEAESAPDGQEEGAPSEFLKI